MKRCALFVVLVCMLLLTGCGGLDEYLGLKDPPQPYEPSLGTTPPTPSTPTEPPAVQPGEVPPSSPNSEEPLAGYWELTATEEVIPPTYRVGDDKDSREYTFEYNAGSIACTFERQVYDGLKKTYLDEEIVTSGGWSQPGEDGAYLPDEQIKLTLTASINSFHRLTTPESGGAGTNFTGVKVWAYLGNTNTPFGNATQGVLTNPESGKSVCSASISNGRIAVQSDALMVGGALGPGQDGEEKVLFIVVSNQGRQGGIKYVFRYRK